MRSGMKESIRLFCLSNQHSFCKIQILCQGNVKEGTQPEPLQQKRLYLILLLYSANMLSASNTILAGLAIFLVLILFAAIDLIIQSVIQY
jgi:hypothetical protein